MGRSTYWQTPSSIAEDISAQRQNAYKLAIKIHDFPFPYKRSEH